MDKAGHEARRRGARSNDEDLRLRAGDPQFQGKATYDNQLVLYYNTPALIIALPTGDGWSVVGLHYINEY